VTMVRAFLEGAAENLHCTGGTFSKSTLNPAIPKAKKYQAKSIKTKREQKSARGRMLSFKEKVPRGITVAVKAGRMREGKNPLSRSKHLKGGRRTLWKALRERNRSAPEKRSSEDSGGRERMITGALGYVVLVARCPPFGRPETTNTHKESTARDRKAKKKKN